MQLLQAIDPISHSLQFYPRHLIHEPEYNTYPSGHARQSPVQFF